MPDLEFVWIGAPNSGSTWGYRALKEHPEVYMPPTDRISYFDFYYWKGTEWYESFFSDARKDEMIGEQSNSYFMSPEVPERLKDVNEDMKLICCLRDPVQRTLSNFNHFERNEITNLGLEEAIEAPVYFRHLIHQSFYDVHLREYLDVFDRDQIHLTTLDGLKTNSRKFIQNIYQFLDVDDSFTPSVLDRKVNRARVAKRWYTVPFIFTANTLKDLLPRKTFKNLRQTTIYKQAKESLLTLTGYKDQDEQFEEKLRDMFRPSLENLELMFDRDFSDWK